MRGESNGMRSSEPKVSLRLSRREVLLGGGAALVGLTLSGEALGGAFTGLLGQNQTFPGVTTVSGAKKPVYAAAMGSTDPVAHSADFIAHLLDPEEKALVQKAMQTAGAWRGLKGGS